MFPSLREKSKKPESKKQESNVDLNAVQNLITIPGAIFNEVYKGAPADRPGKGKTIKSDQVCDSLFDIQSSFDAASCKDRDVLIVSHNKRLQQLIGEMFPKFAASKEGTCPYGIANCAVLEITEHNSGDKNSQKTIYENNNFSDSVINVQTKNNMNRFRNKLKKEEEKKEEEKKKTYKLRVLFNGFPDKDNCSPLKPNTSYNGDIKQHWISTSKQKQQYKGGGSQYAYLTTGEHNFEVVVDKKTFGTFHDIFEKGAKKILLVRHGNGPHNKPCANKLFENPPLTALGVYQAYIAGTEMGKMENQFINVDNPKTFKIFTSQLKRAQQTTLQFLAALIDANESVAASGTRLNKNIRGISNNSYGFSRQQFRKACEKCLKRFNADTRQIDKSGFSSKFSRKSCSFQKLLDDPKFFESEFMKTHPLKYNEEGFVEFVEDNDLANPKPLQYNGLNKVPSKRTSNNNAVSVADSGIGSNTSSLASKSSLASTNTSSSGTGMKPPEITNAEANNIIKGIVGENNKSHANNSYYGIVGGKKTRRRSKAKKTVKKGKGKKMVTKKRMGKKIAGKKRVTKKRH